MRALRVATGVIGMVLAAGAAGMASVSAAPDALSTYRKELRTVDKARRAFWDDFRDRARAARELWRAPWKTRREDTARTGQAPTLYVEQSGFVALFDDCADLHRRRVEPAATLVASGHAKALETVVDALFDVADDIDAADAAFEKVKPSGGWGQRDQRVSVLRHGLAAEQTALETLLASVPGAVDTLVSSVYGDAVKKDGKRSIVRRVAVIDVLARCSDPTADAHLVTLLGAQETFLRIAAAQALVRPGATPMQALIDLASDQSPIVRRALLAEIAADGAQSTAWILAVHAVYMPATGQERADCVAALEALTGANLGDDPSGWIEFVESHADALADGSFDRTTVVTPSTSAPTPALGFEFYGLATPSRAVVFVLDNTTFQHTPADVEVQRTKSYSDWGFGAQGWDKEHESHRAAQTREFGRAVSEMPEGSRFGAVMNKESSAVVTLGDRKLVPGGAKGRKKAIDFLDENPPRAFRSELDNLVSAMELAGLDPSGIPDLADVRADTALMICDGSHRGGHYIAPGPALAAFDRLNRFRRLVVHTVRICDAGPQSESYLSELARRSGGRYRRAQQAPP